MTEVARNYSQPPEHIESGGIAPSRRPRADDGVVAITSIKKGTEVLVVINGCYSLGYAGPDGSEEETRPEPVADKPVDNIALLKDRIQNKTKGDTRKVALYLAERVGERIKVFQLIRELGITKIQMDRIIKTIRTRAEAQNWPFVIRYSYSEGVLFDTRKNALAKR